jgi:hypothetical protein
MSSNIEGVAKYHGGKRLVVLCGAEHRGDLIEFLRSSEFIEVREFYEVE